MKLLLASAVGVTALATYVFIGSKAFAVAGQEYKKAIKGNGISTTENRTIANFQSVRFGGSFEGTLTEGPSPSFSITGDSNLLPHVKQEVRDGVLVIDMKGSFSYEKPIRIVLTTPKITGMDISGASKLLAKNVGSHPLTLKGSGASQVSVEGRPNSVEADFSGASTLKLGKVSLNFLNLNLSGASQTRVSGVANAARVTLSGASQLNGNMTCLKGSFELSGASQATVSKNSNVTKKVSGASSFNTN